MDNLDNNINLASIEMNTNVPFQISNEQFDDDEGYTDIAEDSNGYDKDMTKTNTHPIAGTRYMHVLYYIKL